jgi:2-succinyl-5-enolpyruvyl-6-hydroxy-3-cyclohexene-1-carboxylate synthase
MPGEAAYRCSSVFVAALARAGLRSVHICPGSRSTPLALTFAHSALKVHVHLDERAAAYFALGMAKALREPVALLCTSGTAAANFFPAVIEAFQSGVPLLVLTADRPPELQHTGANQTIDQLKLFGSHVKWFAALPVPDDAPEVLRAFRAFAERSYGEAMRHTPGPVHVNVPFREPLVPIVDGNPLDPFEPPTAQFVARDAIVPHVPRRTVRTLDRSTIEELHAALARAQRGVIVCGPQEDPPLAMPLLALARRFGLPVVADALSHLRCGPQSVEAVIDSYDAFLRDADTRAVLVPDLVLRFGGTSASRPLQRLLEPRASCRHILIRHGSWSDADLSVTDVVEVDALGLCETLLDRGTNHDIPSPSPWLRAWQAVNSVAKEAIEQSATAIPGLFEGRVFLELATLLPEHACLFVGNSMPVRDMESFLPTRAASLRVFANRGASGIDGVTSSALGVAASTDQPVFLVTGDLSFHHDVTGLLAAKRFDVPLTIVLIHNDGGGIFSFLPQHALHTQFEQLFGTPHGLDFQPIVEAYGGAFCRATTWEQFRIAVRAGLESRGLQVIELRTDRQANVVHHTDVWAHVAQALREHNPAGILDGPH